MVLECLRTLDMIFLRFETGPHHTIWLPLRSPGCESIRVFCLLVVMQSIGGGQDVRLVWDFNSALGLDSLGIWRFETSQVSACSAALNPKP